MDAYKIDLSNSQVLEFGQVYVIPLQESLALPGQVQGFANPKSTTGRLDILTRLVTDYGTTFDQTIRGYKGPLYVEVGTKDLQHSCETRDVIEPNSFPKEHQCSLVIIHPTGPLFRRRVGTPPQSQ